MAPHITLAMLAPAFLAVLPRAPTRTGPPAHSTPAAPTHLSQ
ncbi:hypothetical protein [Streptomyces sp.]|nr:hypothetical protein [Streptomyces sp.]